MADISVFHRQKNFGDLMKLEEEYAMRKQQAAQQAQLGNLQAQKLKKEIETGFSTNDPATIRIANEIEAALKAGDIQRANLLHQVHKTMDKGINPYGTPFQYSTQGAGIVNQKVPSEITENDIMPINVNDIENIMSGGTYSSQVIPGYGEAVGSIEAIKKGMEQQASKNVDLMMNPRIAADTKTAEMMAEDLTQSQLDYGSQSEKARQTIDLLNQIEKSPGLGAVVGVPNPFKGGFGLFNVRGSPAADFQAKLDQLGGKQFLEAFESLKGGGQITEKEGEEAKNSIARMQTAQSEEEFLKSLQEFKEIVIRAQERASAKVGQPFEYQSQNENSRVDTILRERGYTTEQINEYKKRRGLQ